jgi:DNA-binding GntR family transcriptional regulator
MGLYQIREVLDGLAASLAARHCRDRSAPAADIAALEQALERGEDLVKTNDIGKLVVADVAFHACIHKLSGNDEIARTVAEQWPQFMRSMGFVLNAADRGRSIWSEHRAIATAILSGKPDEAESLARNHACNAAQQAATELPHIEAAE